MWLDPAIPSVAVRISSMGDLLGTGFIVAVPSESIKGREWRYIVTAHHVLRGQLEPAVEIPDPWGGHELSPPLLINDWRQPFETVDLAIIPVPTLGHNHLTISLDTVLPPGLVPDLGCTVYYVGIFGPLQTPMARGGTLGALEVPIKRPNPNGTEYDYLSHLIDCRSYNGFSGSPCFTQRAYGVANEEFEPMTPLDSLPSHSVTPETTKIYYENVLAGMITAHFTDDGGDGTASRYGVGVMLRSDEIWRALMTDEAKAERREWDEIQKKRMEAEGPFLEELGGSGPGRSREDVLNDFERISGPLRGRNRDQKPEA